MKRILINATHNEEVRVALCKGNHLYDFDLENRTREQKKANIYKGHVTRVEPSLEAVFVEYGSKRQGFLPVREIASEYLSGNPREENIRKLIKEGDELIVQVEKEERGNKGAALSTYVSLAGRYLVLMPNNPKGGGISRQISGKLREDMKRMLGNLDLPKGMSVIVRTAGIGKTQEDLQHDLNHLLNIWNAIQDQNKKYASPRLVHQEAGVVTRAVRDYLRDDISEIWIDNEEAFIEAETFIKAVMPTQIDKLRKYTDFEPMFSSFNVERQIETAYQREVRLPSGGSIVIDQTEALVSIDINSAKSTKGADVAETAYHTNLEAADEIARQLRLRDMGGLIVIDFIDMSDHKHQKEVEKRLVEATKYDRARVQFGEISRFGLMEMSRQRLRPSLEESTGYICPRCHGNGMIRDLRSLSLSIMRQIEQTALKERHVEVQDGVPTDIAAFLLNEKRESLVYLEQDSGTRITILPHAHLESPNFNIHFNHHGFAPASYERVTDTQQQETSGLGYEVDWQTAESERPEQQPIRQPRQSASNAPTAAANTAPTKQAATTPALAAKNQAPQPQTQAPVEAAKPSAVAWLSNLFAPTPQAQMSATVSSADAAQAIEAIVNTGAQSRGAFGQVSAAPVAPTPAPQAAVVQAAPQDEANGKEDSDSDTDNESDNDKDRRRSRNNRSRNKYDKRAKPENRRRQPEKEDRKSNSSVDKSETEISASSQDNSTAKELPKREANSRRDSRGPIERGETKQPQGKSSQDNRAKQDDRNKSSDRNGGRAQNERNVDPNEVNLRVTEAETTLKKSEVVHISLDDTKATSATEAKSDAKSDVKAQPKQDTKSAAKAEDKSVSTEEAPAEKDVQNKAADHGKPEHAKSDTADTEAKAEVVAKPEQAQPKQPRHASEDKSSANKQQKTAESTAKSDTIKTETNRSEAQASEPSRADVSNEKAETTKAEPTADKPVASNSTQNSESENDSLSFDASDLFADRYVAAQKFGQASNDPRLIKASLMKQRKPAPVEEAQTVKAAPITGSVGQFIHTHLAQPSMRLAKDGVIACFLAALNAHKETSGGSTKSMTKRKSTNQSTPESLQAFSFVNYGYQSLSPSYLERFAQMTSAVAAHNIEQGKTQVEPTPIGARATNDPRGQHPDYNAPVVEVNTEAKLDVKSEVETETQTAAAEADATPMVDKVAQSTTEVATNKSSKDSMASLLQLNVGGFINQVLGQKGLDIVQSGQTEAAFLKALNQPQDHLALAAQNLVQKLSSKTVEEQVTESLDQPATALVNEPEADAVSDASSKSLKETKHPETSTSSQETQESSATASNKTSIETYKSMIENISEQLLPQTGLLNLTSPKVPKARSRKTKEEQKKQVQADNTSENNNES